MSKAVSQKANWKLQCGRGLATKFAETVLVVVDGVSSVVAIVIVFDLFLISFVFLVSKYCSVIRFIKIKFRLYKEL